MRIFEVTISTPSAWGSAPPDRPVPEPRATKGTPCSAHARTTAASCSRVLGYDDQRRRDPVVGQPVALVGPQPRAVGDHTVGREQPTGHCGDGRMRVSAGVGIRSSVDLRGEAGTLDARHRGGLVVVGGVPGDADGAEQVTVAVADEHTAGHRDQRAADGRGDRGDEVGLLLGAAP